MTTIDQKYDQKSNFSLGSRGQFWVKITLLNPRVLEKPKFAHNSLNNGRRAVWHHFWTLILLSFLGLRSILFIKVTKKRLKSTKTDQNRTNSKTYPHNTQFFQLDYYCGRSEILLSKPSTPPTPRKSKPYPYTTKNFS